MEIDYLRFALAILATFRIARILPLDDGPLYIFERVRIITQKKALEEHKRKNKDKKEGEKKEDSLGIWTNIYDAVTCPYCQGLYFSFLCILLLIYPTIYGDIFLLIFALAGAQTLLQKWTEK